MVVALLVASAGAGEIPAAAEAHELRNTDLAFLGAELGASLVIAFVVPELAGPLPDPLTCADGWCDPAGLDLALNRALVGSNPKAAGFTSHLFTVGLTPLVAFGGAFAGAALYGEVPHALQDSVILADAFLLSNGASRIAKGLARRQRPAFHFGREADTEAAGWPKQEFLSFWSADTSWAFAFASCGTTLALLRRNPHAEVIAVASGTLALAGGILRISADMHWATDVAAGAVTGAAIGAGLPLLLHGRVPGVHSIAVRPGPSPGSVTISGRF